MHSSTYIYDTREAFMLMYFTVGVVFAIVYIPDRIKQERHIQGLRRKLQTFLLRLLILVLCAVTWPIVGLWLLLM